MTGKSVKAKVSKIRFKPCFACDKIKHMKRIFFVLVLGMSLIINTLYMSVALADTSADTDVLIASLQAKIDELRQQLEQIKTSYQTETPSQPFVTGREFGLITSTLAKGVMSNEVSELQRFLTNQTKYYPEGIISGYFGALTEQAVMRYQSDNNLEPVGVVGPKTRQLINNEIKLNQIPAPLDGPDLTKPINLPASEPQINPNAPLYPAGNACAGKEKGDSCAFNADGRGICDNALNGHLLFCIPSR
jgi:Putative peptidoglycan binding domain